MRKKIIILSFPLLCWVVFGLALTGFIFGIRSANRIHSFCVVAAIFALFVALFFSCQISYFSFLDLFKYSNGGKIAKT